MNLKALIKEYRRPPTDRRAPKANLAWDILNDWADRQDERFHNRLLKTLILRYAGAERKLAQLNRELSERQRRLDEDLEAAAGIQQSLLPQKLDQIKDMRFAWRFESCEKIGGDIFNVNLLDRDHLAGYILDVAGHGVPAALVAVSVSQMLQLGSGLPLREDDSGPPSGEGIVQPKEVLTLLDQQFPIDRFGKFFTMFYIVFNIPKRRLTYCNAGHPQPILIRAGGALEFLDRGGTIVGLGGQLPYEQGEADLEAGDKLVLYTDGVTEHQNSDREFFGEERFHRLLAGCAGCGIDETLERVYASLMEFGGGTKPLDDISLLGGEMIR